MADLPNTQTSIDAIFERIASLAVSENQKDDLIAEFNRRRRSNTLEGFEQILDLPWGVFCETRPNIAEAKLLLNEERSYLNENTMETVKECAKYAILQQENCNAVFPSLCLYRVQESLDRKTLDLLKNLLGRPVEKVHFKKQATKHSGIFGSARSMGRIMAAVKRAKCCNPVILLENTCKIKDKKARRMVEQLINRRKSCSVVDEWIGVPFDLSNVMFIELSGLYKDDRIRVMDCLISTEKKIQVIQKSLLPPIFAKFGLGEQNHSFGDEALRYVVDSSLTIGFQSYDNWIKSIDGQMQSDPNFAKSYSVPKPVIELTNSIWDRRRLEYCTKRQMPVGGVILLSTRGMEIGVVNYLQSQFSKRNCVVHETMKRNEMIQIVKNYCANCYRIPSERLRKKLTIDYPRSDGLSSGCATFLSIFSLFTNRRVRCDSATSGEITLSGRILPIGGVYAKSYAAHRAGIRRMVLSKGNRDDVQCHVAKEVKEGMTFVYVESLDKLVGAMMTK